MPNGGLFIFSGRAHRELGDAFADIARDPQNKVIIKVSKPPLPRSSAMSVAGCEKSLRSLLPLSYLPLVRGRRLRKEAIFYAGVRNQEMRQCRWLCLFSAPC